MARVGLREQTFLGSTEKKVGQVVKMQARTSRGLQVARKPPFRQKKKKKKKKKKN